MGVITEKPFAAEVKKTAAQKRDEIVNSYLNNGNTLAIKHEEYLKKYVTKANEELYQLLSDIMKFAQTVVNDKYAEKIIKEMRVELKRQHNIKTQANSSQLSIIVRFITRTNRKNAHMYSKVLETAIASNVDSNELGGYIAKNGGINKLQKTTNSIADDRLNKLNNLKVYYANVLINKRSLTDPYTSFKVDPNRRSELQDSSHSCGASYKFMACTYSDKGELIVIDAIAVDKDLEEKLLLAYFEHEYQLMTNMYGLDNVEDIMLKRIKQEIEVENEIRRKNKARLRDNYGYLIE
jgi:hypothetical protein